eukprot:Rmarinus@m.8265
MMIMMGMTTTATCFVAGCVSPTLGGRRSTKGQTCRSLTTRRHLGQITNTALPVGTLLGGASTVTQCGSELMPTPQSTWVFLTVTVVLAGSYYIHRNHGMTSIARWIRSSRDRSRSTRGRRDPILQGNSAGVGDVHASSGDEQIGPSESGPSGKKPPHPNKRSPSHGNSAGVSMSDEKGLFRLLRRKSCDGGAPPRLPPISSTANSSDAETDSEGPGGSGNGNGNGGMPGIGGGEFVGSAASRGWSSIRYAIDNHVFSRGEYAHRAQQEEKKRSSKAVCKTCKKSVGNTKRMRHICYVCNELFCKNCGQTSHKAPLGIIVCGKKCLCAEHAPESWSPPVPAQSSIVMSPVSS